ncbi:hypothetical protein MG290_08685 [Flavobacterium sp. CBA20B-1]|uniref:hypothetical protein n=1 Tax=unclassified Flavobacterium TaxID=196869 RepID=UPI0022256A5C|nr:MULTISPECIES: hypothetical protein [unclassified Flavobacterium]WCM41035.1 hypothetical protein MG290_08685 [Flavobacterium sp. CBA20B-1]
MEKWSLIFGIIIIFIVLRTLNTKSKEISTERVSATEFVAKLEKLGYYKYAEENNIDHLKTDLIENFDPNNELVTIWDNETGVPLDYRYYSCDGEAVYEEGGFTDLLEHVRPTFDKIGLKINVTDHIEEWNDEKKWLNHRITINESEYIIFKNFRGYGWGEAVMQFAQIVNEEAEKQGINERLYLVGGGNDGRLIFLTNELYDYIYSVYTNTHWKPLKVREWMKVMNVKPMNYKG